MSDLYAGVDLGGTTISCALACSQGEIVAEEQIATDSHEGPEYVLRRIAELINALAARVDARPRAVGMGVPGLVDVRAGVTRFLPNLPTQWRDVPAAEVLSTKLQCPVRLLNDVRAATLGELQFGHGAGSELLTMAFFSIGTGIGGGVAIEGKLRLGPLGAAGELGHQTILPDGPRCGCGNHGCLEALASGPAIVGEGARLLRSGMAPKLFELVNGCTDRVTPREMAKAALDGDDTVREVLLRAATFLGVGVANVVTILHPELVVLGGGVAEIGELLLARVRQVVAERVGMFPTVDVRIEQSLLHQKAGMLGAVALAASTA